jgi:hypothetical protein
MAYNYCVPLCNGFGGLNFPKDKRLKNKWRVAVKKGVHGDIMKLWSRTFVMPIMIKFS